MKVKLKKPRTLIIRRSNWNGAGGVAGTGLLDSDHQTMCCLGFWSRACGVPRRALKDMGFPSQLGRRYMVPGCNYGDKSTPFAHEAANLNDGPEPQATKETKIARLFKKKLGVTVRFVGRPAPDGGPRA